MMQPPDCMDPAPGLELNPIFAYAAKGQHYENRMAWDRSVHWYQRALACLPNLYGADKEIGSLDLSHPSGASFRPRHASRIYAGLGRVFKASGRQWDSILADQAAAALDPDGGENIETPKNDADGAHAEAADLPVPKGGGSDLREKITLIMATHCTRRLKKFAPLSPPSNKLATATYGSLLSVFGEEIVACPKIMCYDVNPNGSDRDAQYTRMIEAFSSQNGFSLCCFQGVGLFNALNRIIQCVTTPYIFFVEHDWMFRGGRIHLPSIIEMMEDDPGINAIRFNKRDNYLNGLDFLMTVDAAQGRYPLMRTSSYSNNPSILRTKKLKNEWLPICEDALRRVTDRLGGSAFGIEEILFKDYVREIRSHGFQIAQEKWGTYVFGKVGDKPRIIHLGE